MMQKTTYEFDWDDSKAASNLRKHAVRFEEAMAVFKALVHLKVEVKSTPTPIIYAGTF
ncbi:hypothetical protein RGU72_20570 [Undibacterium sp. 5I1]|uniref:hypothetical protein n=1 Tax=Undibacterium sp. 5I1 TaxID=3048590 RepID=UPI002AB3FCA7|nr:hypothetical protein [Undibacterium sp. 5I1]MDY7540653.1 hypothetical protein [Undibacterium sp. 5I1]